MSAQEKAKKKKKAASSWNAKKIGIIIVCVAFAVIMVVSSLGSGWLLSLNPIKSGDSVIVGVTFYDGMNRPVLTTNPRIFNASLDAGEIIWMCGQLSMRANETSQKQLISIPCYNYYYGESKFALFSPEWDTIAMNVDGLRKGENKKVLLPSLQGFERNMTAEEFDGIGGNFTTVGIGDQIILAFAENPTVNLDENVTPEYVIRTAYVTGKSAESVRVNYAYPVAEISLIQVS